jgi:hypothetical protein
VNRAPSGNRGLREFKANWVRKENPDQGVNLVPREIKEIKVFGGYQENPDQGVNLVPREIKEIGARKEHQVCKE